jgi:hypothetical protein
VCASPKGASTNASNPSFFFFHFCLLTMKHLSRLLLLLLLLTHAAQAQTTDPVRQKLDLVFANLDKSQIPTGRLYEAALPLAPLPGFDGLALSDSNCTTMTVFRHLFATALSSRLYGTETLPDLLTFNQQVKNAAPTTPSGAIPIAVQYVAYNYLRPDAETNGLVRLQNEQLLDVAGRTSSPYYKNILFAAAPERSYSAGRTVSLVLPLALYQASGALSTSPTLFLDFGDGQGYRAAAWDQPLNTTYATNGTKRVKVKLTYYYKSFYLRVVENRESWFDLEVGASPSAASKGVPGKTITALYAAGPLDIVIAPTATPPYYRTDYTDHRGATVSIRYGLGHTQVVKPFIVVEQYNTAKVAPHLAGENNKNNTITQFLGNTSSPFTDPFNFNNTLEQAGYDLIYIDFTENTDDIRRNAALFEQVVRMVNTMKAQAGSTEPNVVMGMSMGGLIGRYGLARMVRGGYNPQTRLLVLHDSPQRGANNPMGLQALSRQADFPIALLPGNGQGNNGNGVVRTSDLSDELKEALAILEEPATKQLSIKSVTGVESDYQDNTFIDGAYKSMVEFPGGVPAGFPPIVATSDGSQCGQPQNTPAYQELLRNNRDYLIGPAGIFRMGIQSEAIANALPAYGTQRTIAHLRVWYTIRVLWLKVNITLLNRNYTSPANILPYDIMPGGNTNLIYQQDLVTNHGNGFLGLWRFAGNTSLYNGDICFAPTFSTLDVQTVTSATAFAKYINNNTDNPSPPRVPRYLAQEANGTVFNLLHLQFTARNSEWIFNEMQRPFNGNTNTLSCAKECAIPLIITRSLASGERLCPGSSVTFSVTNQPTGAVVNWSVSPTNLFTTTSGTGTSFTTSASSNTGLGYITATVAGTCGPSLTQTIQVGGEGRPTGIYSAMNATNKPLNTINYVTAGEVRITMNGSENFTFTSSEPNTVPVWGGGQLAGFRLNAGQGVTITARAGGPCGPASNFAFALGSGYYYGFAPNPTSTDLLVTAIPDGLPADSPAAAEAPAFDADLYDNFGKKVKTKKSDKGKALLDVRDLPAGLYNLRAGKGEKALSEHIQITR